MATGDEVRREALRLRREALGPVRQRMRASDVERLAHAAGLHLESFAFGIRGIPERGWALIWTDPEGKAWWLMFANLWGVEAYLVAERPGAPGPVALEDAVRREMVPA